MFRTRRSHRLRSEKQSCARMSGPKAIRCSEVGHRLSASRLNHDIETSMAVLLHVECPSLSGGDPKLPLVGV